MSKSLDNIQCLSPKKMEEILGKQDSNYSPWLTAVEILQKVQNDYSQAKNQLGSICQEFTEKEIATRQHLRTLIPAFEKTSTLYKKNEITEIINLENSKRKIGRAAHSLRAYCLGSFEVQFNWRKYDRWHSLKAKSLFKYLIAHRNKPMPKEVLIETLWPECDPEAGNNNLKSAVYALRQMFTKGGSDNKVNSPIIIFSEGQYLIDPSLVLWVDIDEFEFNWLTGRRLEKANEMNEALKNYQLAEELYRGDYLEDEPYAEWTLLRREALKDTYLAILIKLINASFKSSDYENCIVYSQKILTKDSCSEEAYQWLMRCYSRLGKCHRAQQWYHICAATLKKELDSEPNRKTTGLYKRLINKGMI